MKPPVHSHCTSFCWQRQRQPICRRAGDRPRVTIVIVTNYSHQSYQRSRGEGVLGFFCRSLLRATGTRATSVRY